MWKLRYYWPLIGFVVPSIVIGYGIVLPSNGAAGWNSMTIGFAANLCGAMVAYTLGIASALKTSCPASVPWRVRISRYMNRQASNPHGPFGRILAEIWKREHRRINRKTLDLLDIEPGAHLLELGCGPGEALNDAIQRGAFAVGLDVSATMVAIAKRRNHDALERRCAEVRLVRDGTLDLSDAAFDGVYSVHCLYFWQSPERTLRDIAKALRPGGRLVLAYMPDTDKVPARFRDVTYSLYTPARLEELLTAAGFVNAATRSFSDIPGPVVWTTAETSQSARLGKT